MGSRIAARRARVEQMLLRLLRDAPDGADRRKAAPLVATAMAELAASAGASGLAIELAGSRFVGEDEHILLAWLATRQRPTLKFVLADRAPHLDIRVTAAAKVLLEAGIRLPPPPSTMLKAARSAGDDPAAQSAPGS